MGGSEHFLLDNNSAGGSTAPRWDLLISQCALLSVGRVCFHTRTIYICSSVWFVVALTCVRLPSSEATLSFLSKVAYPLGFIPIPHDNPWHQLQRAVLKQTGTELSQFLELLQIFLRRPGSVLGSKNIIKDESSTVDKPACNVLTFPHLCFVCPA